MIADEVVAAARSILEDGSPAWVSKHAEVVAPWLERLKAVARSVRGWDSGQGAEDEGQCIQAEVEAIEAWACEQEAKASSEAAQGWKEWVSAALDRGARQAHAWARGAQGWAPTHVEVQTQRNVHVNAIAAAERERCRALWVGDDCEGDEDELRPPSPEVRRREQLPRISVEELRTAAGATGKRKAVTYDGFHPRRMELLSDGALETLSVILSACELAGMYPPQLDAVTAPLLPKKDGAFRDIGITPGVVRVHAKARRSFCDEWEVRQGSSIFDAGPKRGAIEAVWRLAVSTEAAVCAGKCAATVSWDLEAFFQAVRHGPLLRRAQRDGVPYGIGAASSKALPRAS